MNQDQNMAVVKTTATINLLAGIWLFVSPWVYQSYALNAWNSWIVGALIVVFAASRLSSPITSGLSLVNVVLGAWTFASPWIYGYTGDSSRFVNSLCVGVIVFILSIYGSSVEAGHPTPPPPLRTS